MAAIEYKMDQCLHIQRRAHVMETHIRTHTDRIILLEYKSIDIEVRTRRNNLIFGGIMDTKGEECTQIIYDFFKVNLKINSAVIGRAQRLASLNRGTNRAMIGVRVEMYTIQYKQRLPSIYCKC